MGRPTNEQKIIKQLEPQFQKQMPIATDMFLPNHSGISNHPEAVNKFLKLDCSNDPLTDTLEIQKTATSIFAGVSGASLVNPTDADGTTTFRMTPALIQSAQGKGATNQQYQWAGVMMPSSNADNLTYRYYYKFGAGAWTVHPFYLDTANGFVVLGLANGEDPYKSPNVLYLLNSTSATSTVDQYSPCLAWGSQGWKTAATAGTQYMGLLQCNAPELGVISPIGVHKWMYGINTTGNSVPEANELMRLQWGSDAGVAGVILNEQSLNDYTFRVEGATNANLLYVDGTNDKIGVGTATPTSLFSVGSTSQFQVDSTGKVIQYNNVATEGRGVPPIHDYVMLTGQTAAIDDTNFTNAAEGGFYRISGYIWTSQVDEASTATAVVHIKWNDGTARDLMPAAINMATADYNQFTVICWLADISSNVKYGEVVSGTVEESTFNMVLTCERLA